MRQKHNMKLGARASRSMVVAERTATTPVCSLCLDVSQY